MAKHRGGVTWIETDAPPPATTISVPPSATSAITLHGWATITPIDAKRSSVGQHRQTARTMLYRGKHRVRSYNFQAAAVGILVAMALSATSGVATITLDGPLPPPPSAFFDQTETAEDPESVDGGPSSAPEPSIYR